MNRQHLSPLMTPDTTCKDTCTAAAVQQKEAPDWPYIERELTRSLEKHVKIRLTVDTPHGTVQLRGFVTVINTYLKEIKLREEDDWQWIRFEDIQSVHI
ncbi:YolD-like family protein [Paenibacillus sp. KQZ6P-2]|uniref:YolD-like family protein n=1 Tax=Paenibacillus mangrovi TaxID=2931978 RepID=A0A9X2B1U9_9BACL|nr:YolD-like family protein [Paenibacillus mangrovi]MCJ8011909.1 YolD-like family protein [Paenibacillus mangrovi]